MGPVYHVRFTLEARCVLRDGGGAELTELFLGAPCYPRAFIRAFRWGWGQRNLYRLDPEATLERDLDEVKRWLAIDPSAAHA